MKIIIDNPLSGKENMTKDYKCYSLAQNFNKQEFILRLYEWQSPTISIGVAQKPNILLPLLSSKIEIVKRHTGGRAVLHYRELTYSISASFDNIYFGGNLYESYQNISKCLILFLKKIGINASISKNKNTTSKSKLSSAVCYDSSGLYEIKINGNKLIGSAQKRGRNAFLQHGSIPVWTHSFKLENFLKQDQLPKKKLIYSTLQDLVSSTHTLNITELKQIFITTIQEYINTKIY